MADVAAIILAAGRATRWIASGGREPSKLLAPWRGRPMARAAVEAALASAARPAIVVTGHEGARVRAALAGLDLIFVENPDYAEGISTSLRVGLAAVPARCAGAVILLADMPKVSAALIDALIAGFRAQPEALAAAPRGRSGLGNPALLGRGLFDRAAGLLGDKGARALVEGAGARRVEIDWPEAETMFDVDHVDATQDS